MAAFSKTAATTENMTAAVFGPFTAVDALPATEYGVFAQELVLAATYENMSDSTSWLSSLADAMESIDTETWTSCEASVMARTLAAFGQHMRAYETNATARLSRLGGELLLASRQIIVKDELRIEWEQQAHADINERDGEIAALKDEIATLKAALAAHAHEMPGTESQSNTDSTATTVPVASDSESTTSSRDAEVPARTGIPQPQLDQSPKLHEQLTQSLPAQDAPLDDAALECAAVQTRAGHSLALIVRQLAEIGDWDVIFQADTLTVYTDRFATAPVTSASILGALTTQGQQLGSLMPKCSATLKSVPHASPDRHWLTDRHEQLCRDVTHVQNWVVGLAYTMCELTESVDREDGPVWQWSPPVDPGPMISADEMRSTARAVGGFYVSCLSSWAVPLQTKPNDFSTLERGSSVLRDVEERIEEVSAVCEWSDLSALATRFADVVAMIDQKLVLCSKAVFLDTRRVSQKYKTKIVRSDSAVFPASRYSLAYYQQVLTKLTKVHTAMIEAAKEGCAKDRRSEIAQLAAQEVRDVLAGVRDWADPRFDKETNASPSEKAAYVDLIYWSESLLEEIRYEMEVHAAC